MRLLLAAALVVAPGSALAQFAALDLKINNADEYVVGPDDCPLNIPVTITVNAATTACDEMKLWFTTATSCPDDPASGEEPFFTDNDLFPNSQVVNVPVAELPRFVGDGGTACGATGVEHTYRVCGSFKTYNALSECSAVAEDTSPPEVIYDAVAPAPPTLASAEGLDTSISVAVEAGDDVSTVSLSARNTQTDDVTTKDVAAPITSRVVISGLENGVRYDITATATDQAGNLSGVSSPVSATPVATSGYFRSYIDAGGTETGGCTSVGFATSGMFGVLVGAWLLARRKS